MTDTGGNFFKYRVVKRIHTLGIHMKTGGNNSDSTVSRRTVLKATGAAAGLGVFGASANPATASSSESYKFMVQNAWMLNGIFGNDTDVAKPKIDERAKEFGQAIADSEIDIVGFNEVFASKQREQIRRPLGFERSENVPEGTYTLETLDDSQPNQVIDVSGRYLHNGADVNIWSRHDGDNQKFTLRPNGDGTYRIQAEHSGKVLDVSGYGTDNGSNIHQWDWHGGDNQRWYVEHLGDGEYKIESKHSGKVLDCRGGEEGDTVHQWGWHGGDNQRWRLIPTNNNPVDWEIGPPAGFKKSSGLYTLTRGGYPIVEMERYTFDEAGLLSRDADAWSNKGVLFTRIDMDGHEIDIFNTHVFAGGGLPWNGDEPWNEEPTWDTVKSRQVSEMNDFIQSVKSSYDPNRNVPTLLAGDLNFNTYDDPYDELVELKENHDLYDAWERYGSGWGPTGGSSVAKCQFDPDDGAPYYCNGGGGTSRSDYILVDEADKLSVEGINRRAFWRELAPPDQFYADDDEEVPNYLGDHLGVEIDFQFE